MCTLLKFWFPKRAHFFLTFCRVNHLNKILVRRLSFNLLFFPCAVRRDGRFYQGSLDFLNLVQVRTETVLAVLLDAVNGVNY